MGGRGGGVVLGMRESGSKRIGEGEFRHKRKLIKKGGRIEESSGHEGKFIKLGARATIYTQSRQLVHNMAEVDFFPPA